LDEDLKLKGWAGIRQWVGVGFHTDASVADVPLDGLGALSLSNAEIGGHLSVGYRQSAGGRQLHEFV